MYVELNGRYTKSLVSCQMRERPISRKMNYRDIEIQEAHLRNAESLVRVAPHFFVGLSESERGTFERGVSKRAATSRIVVFVAHVDEYSVRT